MSGPLEQERDLGKLVINAAKLIRFAKCFSCLIKFHFRNYFPFCLLEVHTNVARFAGHYMRVEIVTYHIAHPFCLNRINLVSKSPNL